MHAKIQPLFPSEEVLNDILTQNLVLYNSFSYKTISKESADNTELPIFSLKSKIKYLS